MEKSLKCNPIIVDLIAANIQNSKIAEELQSIVISKWETNAYIEYNKIGRFSCLRSIAWRIYLKYWIGKPNQWMSTTLESHTLYNKYRDLFPYSRMTPSQENTFIEIQKDARRTFSFFLSQSNSNDESHIQIISRILYIYSSIIPTIGYIQGMNDIVAVLYYCFFRESTPFLKKYIESDTFFCFSMLMSDLMPLYDKYNDCLPTGILGRLEHMHKILTIIDNKLSSYMDSHCINFQMFALKWIIILFAQEFSFDNVALIWDVLLGKQRLALFAECIGVAIIEMKKPQILKCAKTEDIIKLLQATVNNVSVNKLLLKAIEIENSLKC